MLESLLKSIQSEVALKFGLAGTIILLLGWLVYYLVNKLLKDKDEQIKLLAEENKQYREKFVSLLDKQFNFTQEKELKTKNK